MKLSLLKTLSALIAFLTSNYAFATVVYTHAAQVGDDDAIYQTNLVNSNTGATNGGLVEPPRYVTGLDVISNNGNTTTSSGVTLDTETGYLRMSLQSRIDALEESPNVFVTINGTVFESLRVVGNGTLKTQVKIHGDWTFNDGFDINFGSGLGLDITSQANFDANRQTRFRDSYNIDEGQQNRVGEINDILELSVDLFDGDIINWSYGWFAQLSNSLDPMASFGTNLFNLGDTIQFGAFELTDGLSVIAEDSTFLAKAISIDLGSPPVTPPTNTVSAPSLFLMLFFGGLALFMRKALR